MQFRQTSFRTLDQILIDCANGVRGRDSYFVDNENVNHSLCLTAEWRICEQYLYLRENGIKFFYHFTDARNLDSIGRMGGLYSRRYLHEQNNRHTVYNGSDASWSLDQYLGIDDDVHLSFCHRHPMGYRLTQEGHQLVILKISLDVLTLNCRFSDRNAVARGAVYGSGMRGLRNVHLAATQVQRMRRDHEEFGFRQAEVMVPRHIPLEMILNMDNPEFY